MPDGECVVGVELRTKVEGLDKKTDDLHEEDEQQWTAIDKLRELLDRPPAWCAWAMTALGTVAGTAIGALITVLVS